MAPPERSTDTSVSKHPPPPPPPPLLGTHHPVEMSDPRGTVKAAEVELVPTYAYDFRLVDVLYLQSANPPDLPRYNDPIALTTPLGLVYKFRSTGGRSTVSRLGECSRSCAKLVWRRRRKKRYARISRKGFRRGRLLRHLQCSIRRARRGRRSYA